MRASRVLAAAGWVSLAVLLAAAVVVPVTYRATVCADDFVWITNARSDASLAKVFIAAWSTNFFFRPIAVLSNRLINPRSLELAPMLAVQIAGLLTLTAGMWRLPSLVGASGDVPRLVATVWLWLHPAAQLSVWSAGCSSQTWCAAFGIWTICEVLALAHGRIGWKKVAILAALSTGGVIAKDLFLGWATAAAGMVAVRHVVLRGKGA